MPKNEKAAKAHAFALSLVGGEVEMPESSARPIREARRPTFPATLLVKCLSVKDPWINLIGDERKPFELRKRMTHYRGKVILCSSASPSRTPDAKAARDHFEEVLKPVPLGHALYVADLVDCRPAAPGDDLGACCMPVLGKEFVWELRNVRKLPEPQKIKGLLGLYNVPKNLLDYVKREGLLAPPPAIVDMSQPKPLTEAGKRAGWK